MKAFKSITVSELLELLNDELRLGNIDEDSYVAFSSDYGDHCHTEQVHSLRGRIEEQVLTETAYSNSGFAVSDDDPRNSQTVLIIS